MEYSTWPRSRHHLEHFVNACGRKSRNKEEAMARGSVTPRNGGYTAIWDEPRGEDGKRKQRTKGGFKTKKAAEEFLREQLSRIDQGAYTAPTKLTLGEFLREKWLPTLNLRVSTKDNYERNIARHAIPALGGLRLQALTADRLTRFYRQLSASGHRYGGGLAPKAVRNIHGILHRALADARKWNYITRNPAEDADPPKIKSVKARGRERKVWSPEQLRAFLESVRDDRLFAAWMLVATTGLRRGELMGLRWADLDPEAGALTVAEPRVVVNDKVVQSDPKTEAGGRTIALDPATIAALKAWKRVQAEERLAIGPGYVDSGLVFTKPDGSGLHPQRFSAWFGQRAKAAGLPPGSGSTTSDTPMRRLGSGLASTPRSCPSGSATPMSPSRRTSTSTC
jgi:integrase